MSDTTFKTPLPYRTRDQKTTTEDDFMDIMDQVKTQYTKKVDECRRLQALLDAKEHECSDLEHRLLKARKLLDTEKQNTRLARREKEELASQIDQVRDILFKDKASAGRLSAEEMRQKLSDFSYSRSEDDLNSASLQNGMAWKKHQPSTGGAAENKVLEIGGTATVRATTTLTVSKDGTAISVIEPVFKTPGPPGSITTNGETCTSGLNQREHCFQQITIIRPGTCTSCDKRIGTPNQKTALGVIGDYTPTTPPMVPEILIHCINEIERRGFADFGLYRIPAAERDVKALKERFLKGKGAPCLNQIDIHVICGTVKDFLRNIHEPLVTLALRKKFAEAIAVWNPIHVQPALFQVISELPQPNRDILAYMVLHFQKVSEVKTCLMSVYSLAAVFGPIIVGYSSDDLSENALLEETKQDLIVMAELINNIPSDYWGRFVNVESTCQPSKFQQTPSTDSLLRSFASKGLATSL